MVPAAEVTKFGCSYEGEFKLGAHDLFLFGVIIGLSIAQPRPCPCPSDGIRLVCMYISASGAPSGKLLPAAEKAPAAEESALVPSAARAL